MARDAIIGALHRLACRFRASARANVTIIFALALIPIVGLVGAAVDFARGSWAKAAMQMVADATALMLSRDAQTLTASELNQKATAVFLAQFNRTDVSNLAITPTLSQTGTGSFSLNLVATGQVPTTFTRILGLDFLNIEVTSDVVWGMKRLELALVLDVTGSMASQNRMVELKKATKSLLKTLQTAAQRPDDVKVAIVPFAANVNIGTANASASWLDWSDWEAPPANAMPGSSVGPGSSCPYSNSSHGFRCTTGPANGSPNTSTIPSSGSYSGYICPSVDSGGENPLLIGRYYNGCYDSKPYSCTGSGCSCSGISNCSCSGSGSSRTCKASGAPYTHTWIKNARSTWNGCVRDRDKDNDATDATPGSPASTKFQPYQTSYCPAAMLPLTNGWSALAGKVDDLDSSGATNITIGLAWGWHSLTASEPLTQAAAPQNDLDKVIVLMTDGNNTLNRWDGTGYDPPGCAACDRRTALACSNIKAANIKLYTVRLMDGNETLLRDCASKPDMYFNVETASELNNVFSAIAQNLANLRIAR